MNKDNFTYIRSRPLNTVHLFIYNVIFLEVIYKVKRIIELNKEQLWMY